MAIINSIIDSIENKICLSEENQKILLDNIKLTNKIYHNEQVLR